MYTLLSLIPLFLYPSWSRPWDESDAVWAMTVINVLVGVAALRSSDVSRLVVRLVWIDAVVGTVICAGMAFTPSANKHLDQINAVIGTLGLIGMAWLRTGKSGYERLLPVRGKWGRRLAAGLAQVPQFVR